MEPRPGKKWQNLVHRRCPFDGAVLQAVGSRVVLYACREPGCDFLISQRRLTDILTDETHILRGYLSDEDLQKLEEAIAELQSEPQTN